MPAPTTPTCTHGRVQKGTREKFQVGPLRIGRIGKHQVSSCRNRVSFARTVLNEYATIGVNGDLAFLNPQHASFDRPDLAGVTDIAVMRRPRGMPHVSATVEGLQQRMAIVALKAKHIVKSARASGNRHHTRLAKTCNRAETAVDKTSAAFRMSFNRQPIMHTTAQAC